VPEANAVEASLVPGARVRVARSVGELHACLKGECEWPPIPDADAAPDARIGDEPIELGDVRGLPLARHALAASAAGNHHLLMVGPPGVGKTMLARRMPTILPAFGPGEALEVTKVHSAAGLAPRSGLCAARPFRAPHHSASAVALVGGGSPRPRPGEISLAHKGCLFLDELGEFPPAVLDALRQPLEERVVRISRAWGTVEFPADFLLVACSNPCPCGRAEAECRCSDTQRARYVRRLSAPLLDRFDLRLEVAGTDADAPLGPSSADVRAQVAGAVERQQARLRATPWRRNGHVPAGALDAYLPLTGAAARTWRAVCRTRRLSGRGAARIRRLAWTLADLDDRGLATEHDVELAALMRGDVR
jgi:magnesium chelatase family protein